MIERLRKRFIRIATLAVAGVLLLLCVTVNAANYVSVNRQLTQMLQMICDNQGTVPHFPPDGRKVRGTIHWVDAHNCADAEVRREVRAHALAAAGSRLYE